MFDLSKTQPVTDKLRLRRTIIDHIGKTVDIEYIEGHVEDGAFVEDGTNNVHLCNRPAETDENEKVTKPATFDYDDAMKVFAVSKTGDEFARNRLEAKGVIKVQEVTK